MCSWFLDLHGIVPLLWLKGLLISSLFSVEPVNGVTFETLHDILINYPQGSPNSFPEYKRSFQNRFGWDFSGASNMQELQLLLEEKLMIR